MKNLTIPCSSLDFRDVALLSISISADGQTIWINADHRCVLRVQKIEHLDLDDARKK